VQEETAKHMAMRAEAELKQAALQRMTRENKFLQKHLELRKGVSAVYYELGLEVLLVGRGRCPP
jgi:hypothetical protein